MEGDIFDSKTCKSELKIEEESIPEDPELITFDDSDSDDFDDLSDNEALAEDIEESIDDPKPKVRGGRSKAVYEKAYQKFMAWKRDKKVKGKICEDTLLEYLQYLATSMKPNSLWSTYSMLKNTIKANHQIDITDYTELKNFLKDINKGHTRKKSKVFSPRDIKTFLTEAPDKRWLATKVVTIFGLIGALRRGELWSIHPNDVTEEGGYYLVDIPESKTGNPKAFAITGPLYNIVKKYVALRPGLYDADHFFLKYQHGKCMRQNIGIHTLGAMAKTIAFYLNLDEPRLYTGHAYRLSSSKIYMEAGISRMDLRRYGAWKSDKYNDNYVQESRARKRKVCDDLISVIYNSDLPECSSWVSDSWHLSQDQQNAEKQRVSPILLAEPSPVPEQGNTIVFEDHQSWTSFITKVVESRENIEIIFE